jgi:1,4-alpha-glucan branching enzyme
MSKIWGNTARQNPGLHVWRAGTPLPVDLRPAAPAQDGWVSFEYDFEPLNPEPIGMMLFDFDARGNPGKWETHERFMERPTNGVFPPEVWFTEGSSRVLYHDPRPVTLNTLKVHLISQTRYRPSELFLWIPGTGWNRRVPMLANPDALGPIFELTLQQPEKSFFNFKFIRKDSSNNFNAFEPDFANRLWSARDGGEIWTHSEAAEITPSVPARKTLNIRFKQELAADPEMHVWQLNSDYAADITASGEQNGWWKFETQFYTNMRYGLLFRNRGLPGDKEWEHPEATRELQIKADSQFWTLEGAKVLFRNEPQPTAKAKLAVAIRPPFSRLGQTLTAEVRVDRARALLAEAQVQPDGLVLVNSYPQVRTVVRFRDDQGNREQIEGHPIVLGDAQLSKFVVLERPPLLDQKPLQNLFEDPPFNIQRPGAHEANGFVHFVLHAPDAARIDLSAEWTQWAQGAVPMQSTRDGTYWWTQISKTALLQKLGRADYHGAKYKFLFNETTELQDPAAGWVEDSWNGASSKLIDSSQFQWQDAGWQRPGFDYYLIYQLHPARFSGRQPNLQPLWQVAREIDSNGGYLRDLGITAILLLPQNEVGTQNGWGYDPAFFYAIERSYGGPDGLKELVNACHKQGLAVLVDVVFNHAGSIDNILWSTARASFFEGDTEWGAMINFDHPQCLHFFAQNLVYLAREFHIDGFRLDHTHTILHSHEQGRYVRIAGSGGGWEFMHELRSALRSQVDTRTLLMAEHLPNEWQVTNFGGPMDTQWCDNFHDRLIEACRGAFVMSDLARAFQTTQFDCDNWYKATNYCESHDEVGNVRDRVAFVAGWKRGLRMSKVASAATILSRGMPMFFMGAEAAEDAQFSSGSTDRLKLDLYLSDPGKTKVREWWKEMLRLRRSPIITGPSPLEVRYAQDQMLAFSRGSHGDIYVLLNFGGWAGLKPLAELNLPDGTFCELWNSTWPAFAIQSEDEDEHMNWGRDARLTRGNWLHIPDYGVVVLSRVD